MSVLSPSSTRDVLLELMARRILLLDGAMGTMVFAHKPTEADYRGERFKNRYPCCLSLYFQIKNPRLSPRALSPRQIICDDPLRIGYTQSPPAATRRWLFRLYAPASKLARFQTKKPRRLSLAGLCDPVRIET